MKEDLTKKIERLGFTTYEAKVFLVLYQGYKMSAAEIAKEAKIPRTSVYDILKKFTEKGFCNEVHTPSKLIYEVINSKVLEDKIKIEIELDYKGRIATSEECFTSLRPMYKTKQPRELKADVELIKGYNRLRDQKFLELVKNSKQGILIMNKFRGKVSLNVDDESKKFFKRGGKVKSIYQSKGDFKLKINNKWQDVTREGLIQLCESFAAQGEEIRFMHDVPQIMAIFDEKVVYFSLFDEDIPIKDMSDVIIYNANLRSLLRIYLICIGIIPIH